MHTLHSLYATNFNLKYGRVGHLFQSRYGSNRIWSPGRFDLAVEYIEHNPVEAGLSRTAEDWPWGSASVLASGDVPRWLLDPRATVIDWDSAQFLSDHPPALERAA